MVVYNFKDIPQVPTKEALVDIVLTRTQRGTPTVVHAGWQISRIREFYMRKVKYTQENFRTKFEAIVNGFPKLDVSTRANHVARLAEHLVSAGAAREARRGVRHPDSPELAILSLAFPAWRSAVDRW